MLVIVEDGNIEFGTKSLFDFEAARCGDIFKVNAAVRGGNRLHNRDDLFSVLRIQDNRPRINVTELLEENSLAFHNGKSSLGTNVAQAQNSSAIRNNRNRVGLHRQQVSLLGHVMDCGAHASNTRSVCAGEIIAVTKRNLRMNFNLAADVSHEGLVCNRGGMHAFKTIQNLAYLTTMVRITHVAGEVNDDVSTIRIGDVKALDLCASRRYSIHDLRDRESRLIDLKAVGRGV